MEPNATNDLLQSIKANWLIISAFVAFLVGYVTLRVEFHENRKRSDEKHAETAKRIDRLEDEMKDDIKVIRAIVERLLERGN